MNKAEIIAKYAIHEGDTGSIPAVACSRWSAAAAAFRTTLKRPTSSATARYAPSLACASN